MYPTRKIIQIFYPIIFLIVAVLSGCNSQSEETSSQAAVFSRAASIQIESVNPPACDPVNPDTLFIDEAADWGFINDPAYRIFCVSPGDYSSIGDIRLTSSGTAAQPRIISVMQSTNGSVGIHPAKTPESGKAILEKLVLNDAHHWIIDGLTIRGNPVTASVLVRIEMRASNNILNRMLIEDGSMDLVRITGHGSNNNTIQNSVIRKSKPAPMTDHHCIALSSTEPNEQISGTRILNNEIYDCTDGIQLTVHDEAQNSHFPDTLIINNDIYITPSTYTDCSGTPNRNGECAAAENGVDIKSGAKSPENAVIVANNRLWGFRKTDTLAGGTGSAGTALQTCCSNPAYILFSGNIITDSASGIGMNSGNHVSVIDNLIHNIQDLTLNTQGHALYFYGNNHEAYRNIVVDADHWSAMSSDNSDYRCNTIINGGNDYAPAYTGVTSDFNAYYNSAQFAFPGLNDVILNDATLSDYTARCIWRKQWTGPEKICIPHGTSPVKSQASLNCDPQLGSRKNIGVDNTLY
jgi:hypothetical protein